MPRMKLLLVATAALSIVLAACGSGDSQSAVVYRTDFERMAVPAAGVFTDGPRAGGRYDRLTLGDPDAPVLIRDYSDFL